MTDTLVSLLLTWLLLWAALCLLYAVLLFGLDYLASVWQRHQQAKRQRPAHLAELARIDQQATAAMQRIGAAYVIAQQLIRTEAASNRERRS